MVDRLLMVKSDTFDEGSEKSDRIGKTHSFNTDDGEDDIMPSSRQLSKSNSEESKLDLNASTDLLSPRVMTHSASIDTLNDQESLAGDAPSEKTKKKRKRLTPQPSIAESRKSTAKKRPWYAKIDLTKPAMYLIFLVILYLMWTQRDVWIPRLLTSNSRVRHTALLNEQKLQEQHEHTHSSSSKDSSSKQNDDEDKDGDDDDDDDDDDDNKKSNNNNNNNNININNVENNQTSTTSNTDDDTPTTTTNKPSTPHAKLNIRTRRNKMSFSKDSPTKKRRYLRRQAVEGDDDVENIYDDIDDIDDVDDTDDEINFDDDAEATDIEDEDDDDGIDEDIVDEDEKIIKPIKGRQPILPSSIHSPKKNQHHHHHQTHQTHQTHHNHNRQHRSVPSHEDKQHTKVPSSSTKTGVILSQRVDIAEQIKQLMKSRGRKDVLATIMKETGLDKARIHRFIQKKDFSVITLDILLNFLDSHGSTLLIVSK